MTNLTGKVLQEAGSSTLAMKPFSPRTDGCLALSGGSRWVKQTMLQRTSLLRRRGCWLLQYKQQRDTPAAQAGSDLDCTVRGQYLAPTGS